MDAFESLIESLLRREGYWTATSVKVSLSQRQKVAIGRPSSPRWELDLVAYKGRTNELLVVECKSYLDSRGVTFRRGQFEPAQRYKLFTEPKLRRVVLRALETQLIKSGACSKRPKARLGLAAGRVAGGTDRVAMDLAFKKNGWELFDDSRIRSMLRNTKDADYENDVALVATKILLRTSEDDDEPQSVARARVTTRKRRA